MQSIHRVGSARTSPSIIYEAAAIGRKGDQPRSAVCTEKQGGEELCILKNREDLVDKWFKRRDLRCWGLRNKRCPGAASRRFYIGIDQDFLFARDFQVPVYFRWRSNRGRITKFGGKIIQLVIIKNMPVLKIKQRRVSLNSTQQNDTKTFPLVELDLNDKR